MNRSIESSTCPDLAAGMFLQRLCQQIIRQRFETESETAGIWIITTPHPQQANHHIIIELANCNPSKISLYIEPDILQELTASFSRSQAVSIARILTSKQDLVSPYSHPTWTNPICCLLMETARQKL